MRVKLAIASYSKVDTGFRIKHLNGDFFGTCFQFSSRTCIVNIVKLTIIASTAFSGTKIHHQIKHSQADVSKTRKHDGDQHLLVVFTHQTLYPVFYITLVKSPPLILARKDKWGTESIKYRLKIISKDFYAK